MAVKGKSINLFLMDGESTGRIKCTLANWTGVAYKIPRTALDLCKDRDDLKQSGIYFLFGTSDHTGNNVVYVGQAGARKNGEGLLNRLQEHTRNPNKDYWTEAVVFTTSNNSFGPTEISFLENRFCGMATVAGRYEVKNGIDPNPGNITEEKESELEEFVDYARIIMGVLGHKVFEPIASSSTAAPIASIPDTEPILHFRRARITATGQRTSEGFVVFKGSQVEPKTVQSCPQNILKLRTKYEQNIDENSRLNCDVLFTSPSAAASFIGGSAISGYAMWETEEGVSLKNIEISDAQ